MIVGINYGSDGKRYISAINYSCDRDSGNTQAFARAMECLGYDEVYIIDIDKNHQEFIDYIVTHGCRL